MKDIIDRLPLPVLRKRLLDWYSSRRRVLPWRQSHDPYHVWVSEVMLQQTQVQTVLRYYGRFIERFPTVEALAAVELDEVLSIWQGLGYYQRARWLHAAARKIVLDYGGRIPRRCEDLLQLPGFGAYTARAVASIAFGEAVGVVDGNVRRVLCRLLALPSPALADLQKTADRLVDPEYPGDFNQAMMELGSLVCTPRHPDCRSCPIRPWCRALSLGRVEDYPSPKSRNRIHGERYWVGLWSRADRWLLGHRERGLLKDMWLFPMWPRTRYPDLPAVMTPLLQDYPDSQAVEVRRLPTVTHVFSHRRWVLDPIWVVWPPEGPIPNLPDEIQKGLKNRVWFPRVQLRTLPIPRAHRKLLSLIFESDSTIQPRLVADDMEHYAADTRSDPTS